MSAHACLYVFMCKRQRVQVFKVLLRVFYLFAYTSYFTHIFSMKATVDEVMHGANCLFLKCAKKKRQEKKIIILGCEISRSGIFQIFFFVIFLKKKKINRSMACIFLLLQIFSFKFFHESYASNYVSNEYGDARAFCVVIVMINTLF